LISLQVVQEQPFLYRMGRLGRTLLAAFLAVAAMHVSSKAGATIEVSDSGASHDSVWRAADVGLYLDASLEDLPDAEAAVGAALAVWEAEPLLPRVWPMSGKADSLGYRAGEPNRNTIRFADCGAPQAKGALAITLVSYDSEQHTIVDGDVLINGIYRFGNLRASSKASKASGRPMYDLTDVLLHELGHWFGLADNPEDADAVMYPYFNPGELRGLSLSSSDHDALNTLYANAPEEKKGAACSVAAPGAARCSGASLLVTLALLWLSRRGSRCGLKSPPG
jgi:hypothetical protein